MKKYTQKQLSLPLAAGIAAAIFLFSSPTSVTAQATWQQSNGPSGGYTQYVSGGPGGVVFTISLEYDEDFGNDARLARSFDEGLTWEKLSLIEGLTAIVGVEDAGALYIKANGALLRSPDNGNTWVQVYDPLFGNNYLLQDSDSVMYIYGQELLLSEDAGQSWTRKADNYSERVTVNSAGNLIKEQYSALWISTDRGTNWEVFADVAMLLNGAETTAITTNSMDEIFVASSGTGVIKVSPDGSTMERINDQFSNVQHIIATNNDLLISLAQFDSIWISNDNGQNWQLSNQGQVSYVTSRLNADSSGNIYVGTAEGVMKSDNDGASWVMVNEGLRNATVYSIEHANDSLLLAATSYRVLRSGDGGNTWQQVVGVAAPKTISTLYSMHDGSFYYIVTDYRIPTPCDGFNCQYLYRSQDGGVTWTEVAGEIQIYQMVLHPDGQLFLVNSSGLMISSDNGVTWEPVDTGLDGFASLAVDTAGALYVNLPDGLFKSEDNGLSWDLIAPVPAEEVLAYDYLTITLTGEIFVSTTYYWGGNENWQLHRLDDGDWTDISPFGESMYTDFHVDQYGTLYMSTFYGLFRSTDQGNEWDLIAENGDYWVPAVTTDPQGRIYASYTGRGIWMSDTWVSSKPLPIASKGSISVFPNPASNRLYIKYETNSPTVLARLYNIQGELVKRVLLNPSHMKMNVSELPAGVYTLQVDDAAVKVVVE